MLILRYLHVIEDIRFTVCFWLCLSVFEICVCLLEMAKEMSLDDKLIAVLMEQVAAQKGQIAAQLTQIETQKRQIAKLPAKAKRGNDGDAEIATLKARLAECESGNVEYAAQNECLRSDLSTAVDHISTLETALSKLGQAPNEEITRFCCEMTYNIHGEDDEPDDGQPPCAPGEVFEWGNEPIGNQ